MYIMWVLPSHWSLGNIFHFDLIRFSKIWRAKYCRKNVKYWCHINALYVYIIILYQVQFSGRDALPQNNFDPMLTFSCSPFRHFEQEVNEIWYPGRSIIYTSQISNFINFMYKMVEWRAIKCRCLIEIILWENVHL